MCDLEKLRLTFRPESIVTLFVGESPPHNGTFFYKGNSVLYFSVKESFGGTANFLAEFKAKCFFLDDLVLYPVNKLNKKEREENQWKGVASLAQRMAVYGPAAVVVLMCAIEEMVVDAMSKAGLSHVPHFVTPFPGRYHRGRFREKMAEIIPKLPTC
jgi:hypothetical protein